MLVERGEYRLEHVGVGQVLWVPLSSLRTLLEVSAVLLDAVMDAVLLCGDADALSAAKRVALEYVEGLGLVRTGLGWVRRDLLYQRF